MTDYHINLTWNINLIMTLTGFYLFTLTCFSVLRKMSLALEQKKNQVTPNFGLSPHAYSLKWLFGHKSRMLLGPGRSFLNGGQT